MPVGCYVTGTTPKYCIKIFSVAILESRQTLNTFMSMRVHVVQVVTCFQLNDNCIQYCTDYSCVTMTTSLVSHWYHLQILHKSIQCLLESRQTLNTLTSWDSACSARGVVLVIAVFTVQCADRRLGRASMDNRDIPVGYVSIIYGASKTVYLCFG